MDTPMRLAMTITFPLATGMLLARIVTSKELVDRHGGRAQDHGNIAMNIVDRGHFGSPAAAATR
jgi:hypothetical protein